MFPTNRDGDAPYSNDDGSDNLNTAPGELDTGPGYSHQEACHARHEKKPAYPVNSREFGGKGGPFRAKLDAERDKNKTNGAERELQ